MKEKNNRELWQFNSNHGDFESVRADSQKSLYFPLANEKFMSSVSPDLHGDAKLGQGAFLLAPVSRIDLVNQRASRNFWVSFGRGKLWSATGVSRSPQQKGDQSHLQAGLLWHSLCRQNKSLGLEAEIISFIPANQDAVEIMQVKLTNICGRAVEFTPSAAIPIYARSGDNIRDHRHVTSLLNRIKVLPYGVAVKPTMLFDESGHKPNHSVYFSAGWDKDAKAPEYIYPTQEMFCGDGGDLEAPESLLNDILPDPRTAIQGREALAGLRFADRKLRAGESVTYCVVMGIAGGEKEVSAIIAKYRRRGYVNTALEAAKSYWNKRSGQVSLSTKDPVFDNWFRWVSIQPLLRRIFGCSFLPDFDYGKGGRGWRDLWQDSLSLIISEPDRIKELLANNFAGVRIDGSNATIIGKKPGEFIADRNNISRVWMDHGVWPLLTLDLYINETNDAGILLKTAAYFRDPQTWRSRRKISGWDAAQGKCLKTKAGKVYKGTILEHLLVENLVQFYNVGGHNFVRLEGADWNDGLDMAKEHGESVAFSSMYAHNLQLLSAYLNKMGNAEIAIAREIKSLLGPVNYNDAEAKNKLLERYFSKVENTVSGEQVFIPAQWLAGNLREKSEWMMQDIRRRGWLKEGFFNGYYDNKKKQVEGLKAGRMQMTLTGQVFAVMSGVASDEQIPAVIRNVNKYLYDKKLKGYRLNTDFGAEQPDLGRAFSFAYGDKENGAFFNHMVVMYAYALYNRGYVEEGWQALKSIYDMAVNTQMSKIYPCLPEYFDGEGRGKYAYLTGSASWFVLTLLTQAFGVKGKDGDLYIEPKLSRQQFPDTGGITIYRTFANRRIEVQFLNPEKSAYPGYRIVKASLNNHSLLLESPRSIRIPRKMIEQSSPNKTISITVHLS